MVKKIIAEAFGTFLLVLFGLGVVHAAVLTDAQVGLWQVAVVWGLGIALAIYCVGAVSGAHLNPAITIALACHGRHSKADIVPYIVGQVAGAFIGAAVLYTLFAGFLTAKETAKGVRRGEPQSIVTAMCYGEFFPNPGNLAAGDGPFDPTAFEKNRTLVTLPQAFFAEALGTMILAIVIFAVTDRRNVGAPSANLGPAFIGLTVSALISFIAPLTQAGFNPARDFGPRLFSYFAGWGSVAWSGNSDFSWLTVYILAPILGALVGGGVYDYVLRNPPEKTTPKN